MNSATEQITLDVDGTDDVLAELWQAREEISAACGHDLDKLFESFRRGEALSGHSVVNLEPSGHVRPADSLA